MLNFSIQAKMVKSIKNIKNQKELRFVTLKMTIPLNLIFKILFYKISQIGLYTFINYKF